jgi:hypothetical protein
MSNSLHTTDTSYGWRGTVMPCSVTIPPNYLAVTRVNFADEDQQRIQTDDTGNAMVLEPVKFGITGMFSG